MEWGILCGRANASFDEAHTNKGSPPETAGVAVETDKVPPLAYYIRTQDNGKS